MSDDNENPRVKKREQRAWVRRDHEGLSFGRGETITVDFGQGKGDKKSDGPCEVVAFKRRKGPYEI